MKIAVIGGGNGCYAAAADLSEQGHEIRLWRRDGEALAPVMEQGGITLTDHAGRRDIAIHLATADVGEAVAGAELIMAPLPATAQIGLGETLAPVLEDGQVVFLPPGTFGTYLLARAQHAAGNKAAVAFAEAGTLPYLARKRGPAEIAISARATRLPTGVFPSRDSERAFAILEAAYPAVERLSDALDGALMNAGPIIHPPLILMNAGPLQHSGEWDIHNEGTQPAIRHVTDVLDGERITIRTALGYEPPHFPLTDHYDDERPEWMYGNAAHERLTDSGDWREPIDLQSHRYMLEDIALGLTFLESLAKWAGVETAMISSILTLAGVVAGDDFRISGRTLANLGLAGMSHDEMCNLLEQGFA
jgi:opine dehydrogenase